VVEGQEEHEAEAEELFSVGIVFEGYPSSGRFDVGEARDATIAVLCCKRHERREIEARIGKPRDERFEARTAGNGCGRRRHRCRCGRRHHAQAARFALCARPSQGTVVEFLNETDLFIRALALTPAIFDEWIRECGF
jgi:hypothetical protein